MLRYNVLVILSLVLGCRQEMGKIEITMISSELNVPKIISSDHPISASFRIRLKNRNKSFLLLRDSIKYATIIFSNNNAKENKRRLILKDFYNNKNTNQSVIEIKNKDSIDLVFSLNDKGIYTEAMDWYYKRNGVITTSTTDIYKDYFTLLLKSDFTIILNLNNNSEVMVRNTDKIKLNINNYLEGL